MPHARRWKTSARKTLKLLGHRTPQSRRVLQCRCTTQPILSAERQPPRVGQLEGEENGEKDGTVPCTHKNKHMHKKRVQAHGCCLNWMCTEAAEGKKKKKSTQGGHALWKASSTPGEKKQGLSLSGSSAQRLQQRKKKKKEARVGGTHCGRPPQHQGKKKRKQGLSSTGSSSVRGQGH